MVIMVFVDAAGPCRIQGIFAPIKVLGSFVLGLRWRFYRVSLLGQKEIKNVIPCVLNLTQK